MMPWLGSTPAAGPAPAGSPWCPLPATLSNAERGIEKAHNGTPDMGLGGTGGRNHGAGAPTHTSRLRCPWVNGREWMR